MSKDEEKKFNTTDVLLLFFNFKIKAHIRKVSHIFFFWCLTFQKKKLLQ